MLMVITIIDTLLAQAFYKNNAPILFNMVVFMVVVTTLYIISKENIKYIFIYALAMIVSISMLVQLARELVSAVCKLTDVGMTNDFLEMVALSFLIIAVFVSNKFFRTKHGLKNVSFEYNLLLNIIIVIDSICISFLGYFIPKDINAKRMWGIELAYIFTVLGVFVQLGLLIAMILSRDEHKEKEALNAKYLEEQKNHYEYLKHRELETKKFRHDIKQQMTLMKTLYREGEIEQFEEILNSIGDRINTFTKHVSVGNDTADAIINQYVQEAEKAGIKLSVEGHFPPDFHIAAVDLCTVLANLLSNAIRAERDANGDEVKLMVRNLDNELFVEVSNHYITEVKRNGERFMSTKKDRANHGLGLQNIYDCVERNHGVIHITTDNQIFDVKLNLKNAEA